MQLQAHRPFPARSSHWNPRNLPQLQEALQQFHQQPVPAHSGHKLPMIPISPLPEQQELLQTHRQIPARSSRWNPKSLPQHPEVPHQFHQLAVPAHSDRQPRLKQRQRNLLPLLRLLPHSARSSLWDQQIRITQHRRLRPASMHLKHWRQASRKQALHLSR